ncbi:xylosidase/arabinosidase [Sorangium cellulosum]|uniref:Xylosidase/arabinosidase n=1 Tax=Sorangium cellulosum TaxID=56 RepID=A0A4P2PU66_SORCE|nr:family 43 glycosylhydrolase [Sorangium cellulosum]AUX20138.1 xylosidase/arabinosidase [Sorangium cellulosum]
MKRYGAPVMAILLVGSLTAACGGNESENSVYTLVIEASGEGTTDPGPGTYPHAPGSLVTVTATPAAGYNFLGWSGAVTGLDDRVTVTLDMDKTLTATFGTAFEPTTYQNPVLPGDHPDMNIYREGDAFYLVGSTFHMMPAFEILRSTDLVRWERVTRVVHSTAAALKQQTGPGQGTWGGFIVKANDVYRVYYAIGATQYFSSAPSLEGPWSEPTQVDIFPYTPPGSDTAYERGTGSDNSVFVDPDSGKTYMLIKNGLCKWDADHPNDFGINLVTEIDPDTGMLLPESSIDMSFVNWDQETGGCGEFSNADWSKWGEGPTMTKRGDWYYYFISTHTACGGQLHAWASKKLVDSTPEDWTWLGYVLTGEEPYAGVQHITAPFELEDGTSWAFAHSYDCTGAGAEGEKTWSNGEWMGLGREGLLLSIDWVDQEVGGQTIPVPQFTAQGRELPAPALPRSGVPFLLPVNDDFTSDEIDPAWTTYDKSENRYSVTERPGWLRIDPGADRTTWVVQKEALRSSSMVVKMEFTPRADGDAAGVRLGNGYWRDEQVLSAPTWMTSGEGFTLPAIMEVSVARVMEDKEDRIRFSFRSRSVKPASDAYTELDEPVVEGESVAAPPGEAVWLKLVRTDHKATGWFSTDGVRWTQVGREIDISALDHFYAMAHTWVGNQAGMFATNKSADFDLFTYRDGFTQIQAAEANQQSGTDIVSTEDVGPVLGGLEAGDWAMYGSVGLGGGRVSTKAIELRASSAGEGGVVEIWLDPLAGGSAIGTCKVPGTGGWDRWTTTTCDVKPTTGTHDVYLKVTGGKGELLRLTSLRFVPTR